MYTIEKLKERNSELRDEIVRAIEEYMAATGCTPTIEVEFSTSIGAPPRPIVYVATVIR